MSCDKEPQEEYYKEEYKEWDEDFAWKRKEEKLARLKYKSSLTPRLVVATKNNLTKKFKQKVRC